MPLGWGYYGGGGDPSFGMSPSHAGGGGGGVGGGYDARMDGRFQGGGPYALAQLAARGGGGNGGGSYNAGRGGRGGVDLSVYGLPVEARSLLYKTEMCKNYLTFGVCQFSAKCQFAHGLHELRQAVRHPKWRQQKCKTFWTYGGCTVGRGGV